MLIEVDHLRIVFTCNNPSQWIARYPLVSIVEIENVAFYSFFEQKRDQVLLAAVLPNFKCARVDHTNPVLEEHNLASPVDLYSCFSQPSLQLFLRKSSEETLLPQQVYNALLFIFPIELMSLLLLGLFVGLLRCVVRILLKLDLLDNVFG
jgi:hypothetical protein